MKKSLKQVAVSLVLDHDPVAHVAGFWIAEVEAVPQPQYVEGGLDDLWAILAANKVGRVYIQDLHFVSRFFIDYLCKKNAVEYHGRIDQFKGLYGYNVFEIHGSHVYNIELYINAEGTCNKCTIFSCKDLTRSKLSEVQADYNIVLPEHLSDIKLHDYTVQSTSDADIRLAEAQCFVSAAITYIIRGNGCKKNTIGADAYNYWLKLDNPDASWFPELGLEVDKYLREAYRGGLIYINPRYKNKELTRGICLDVNSLYSFVMRECPLPYGAATYFEGLDVDAYLQDDPFEDDYFVGAFYVKATLKNNHVPCISLPSVTKTEAKIDALASGSTNISNDYADNLDCQLTLTNFDILNLYQNYDVEICYNIDGYQFHTGSGMFNNFIDHFYESKRVSTGAKREVAKLHLEAFYGGFGLRPDASMVDYSIVDDKIEMKKSNKALVQSKRIRYLPISMFVTAIGRYLMLQNACEMLDRLVYIDTDGLHLLGTDVPECIDISDQIGGFKVEAVFTRAKYCGYKIYIHDEAKISNKYSPNFSVDYNNIVTNVKIAGAPEKVQEKINWSTFRSGYVVDTGNTTVKIIPGGAWRVDSSYTLPYF